MGTQWMDSISRGNHLLIGPMRDNAAALLDTSTGKITAAFKMNAVDLHDQTVASASASGGVSKIVPARNALLVLTASQRVYSIDLPAAMRMTR